jgi:hypothetical protein
MGEDKEKDGRQRENRWEGERRREERQIIEKWDSERKREERRDKEGER